MKTRLTIKPNGSIRVEGDFEIVDGDGNPFDLAGRTVVSLCRCGLSQDMPFCDKRHRDSEFRSVVTARALPPPAPKPE